MKKGLRMLMLLALAMLVVTSCKDETVNEFEVLNEYLTENQITLSSVKGVKGESSFFVMAPSSESDLDGKYLMDIRSAEDFAKGHIAGANNVAFSNILSAAEGAGSPIVIICYTGQTACYATAILRMAGYSDTRALKWGMSGWNSHFSAPWNGKIDSDVVSASSNWVTSAAPAEQSFSYPVLETGYDNGSSILDQQISDVIAAGFGAASKSGSDVITNPGGYFINNYFSEADYTGFGHFDGAYRIMESFSPEKIDPAAEVLTYCYTGQTSALISGYLRVLGYNAKTITFGMNGLYHSSDYWDTGSVANHWGENANPKEFSWEGTDAGK